MAFQDIDPLTGLPRRLATNTPYSTPMFAATSPGATGGTTTGATGNTGMTGQVAAATGQTQNPFEKALNEDPYWIQLNKDLSAQGIADEDGARAAAQRAFIQFGEIPADVTGKAASWIDDTTRQLAAQNTQSGLSRVARLNKANTDAIRSIRNALAARGALRSGEFGFQLGENQKLYEQAQYDQRQALTDTLMGIQAGLAAAQRAAQNARTAGMGQVVTNYYNNPPPAPTAPPGTVPAPPGPRYPGDQYSVPDPAPPGGYDTPPDSWSQWGSTTGGDPFLTIDPSTGLPRRR